MASYADTEKMDIALTYVDTSTSRLEVEVDALHRRLDFQRKQNST